MPHQTVILVEEASQVGESRRAAVRLAEAAGLGEAARGEVAIVATELATNLAKYGKNGRLLLQAIAPATGACVELIALDAGPGMADIQRCLRDGFSSGGTAGTGLGAVRRLSIEFDLYSVPGRGTVVFSRVCPRPRAPVPTPRPNAQWAAISVPAPGETVCGDAWRVCERDGQIAVLVADGLGHGPLAFEAAERAVLAFEERPFDPPAALLDRAHRALAGTRGAAVAVALLSLPDKVLRYSGVGNIAGSLLASGATRGLFTHNGTVGLHVRKVHPLDYAWPDRGGLLVMHSDGLQSRWSLNDYPGLMVRHPAIIAGVLYRDLARGRDDATVVVLRTDVP